MKRLVIHVLLIIILSINLAAQDHKLFTDILKNNVEDGLVNYKSLLQNKSFNIYIEQLSSTNPEELNRNEKLAFWINAYNAFTLQIILENYPVESITDLHTGGKVIGFLLGKTVWDKEFITINNREYSLNFIEHEILRKMNESRIHFAIVCASISCPELRNEAYEADNLLEQIEDQTKIFLNDNSRNSFTLKKREANISEIFNWFEKDFGSSDENVLKFISSYLPEKIAKNMRTEFSEWDIAYKNYNWNLNETK